MKDFFEALATYFRAECAGVVVRTPYDISVEDAETVRIEINSSAESELVEGNKTYEVSGDVTLFVPVDDGETAEAYRDDFREACLGLNKELVSGGESFWVYRLELFPPEGGSGEDVFISRSRLEATVQL